MKRLLIAILFVLSIPAFSQTKAEKAFYQNEKAFREYVSNYLSHGWEELEQSFIQVGNDLAEEGKYELAARAICRAAELETNVDLQKQLYGIAEEVSSGGYAPLQYLEARVFGAVLDGFSGNSYTAWKSIEKLVPQIDDVSDPATKIKLLNGAAMAAGRAYDVKSTMALFEKCRSVDPGEDVCALSYIIDALGNYGAFLTKIGVREEALDMAGEAGKYYDRLVKGDGVPCIMARHMYDMGLILVRLNDYDNNNETAIECLSFAEELYMDQYGEENIELIHVRKQLANVLIDEGRYDEAFPLLYKAIAQAEVFLGHDHSEQVISYYFYGFGLYKAGRVEEARKQLGESERIRKKLHTYDINGLLMLALMDYMSGDFEKACSQGWELFNVEKEYLREITLALPESDRESSWMQHGAQVMGAVFTLAAYAPEGGPLLYDAALFAKGTLMSAASRLNSIIERDGTGRLAALRDEYRTLYFQAEALSAGGEKTEGEFDELRRKARLLETDLVSHSSVFGDILSEVSATWEDVSKCLAPKEAAVEFVRFNSMRGKYVYMASVLLPGRKPVNVELPDLSDALLQKASGGSAFTSPELFKAVFGPIMPYVRDCGRVWFSPTGEMSVVPLENIRSTEGEKTASEVLPLRRLSSTRVLLQTDGARRWENAVLFGGLDYNISAEEKEYYAEASSSGVRSKSLHDWGYLRGSLSEVESIAGILSGIDVVKVTGGDGVEERFKALSGKGVNLLHVATHGFYSEDVAREVFNAGFALEDVLMGSCGLVFAGANTLNGGNANLDNGLLSATEISRLDLSGCDLVVLSACGTGLGAVNFDESYGLVRAFKKAGCRSILMSLWDIDDKATAVFMQAFYSARTGGKDNGAALEEAKAVVRKAFPDPKYWAGFVLID